MVEKISWRLLIVWNETRERLEEFHGMLNNLHPSIQFTMEMNDVAIPFLNSLLIKQNGKITTNIFHKETDTHQYLNFNFCHPPLKEIFRTAWHSKFVTLIKDAELRNRCLEELEINLLKQKYPKSLVRNAINKAQQIPSKEFRKKRTQSEENDLIPFITTYNPKNLDITTIAKTNVQILQNSRRIRNIITKDKILSNKWQPRNLKRLLTRARFNSSEQETKIIEKCGDPRCGTCRYIHTGPNLKLKNGREIYPNANLNCKSVNLIYCIVCSGCNEWYIGQTGSSLCERIRIHRQQIRSPSTRQIPLSEHLDVCGHQTFIVFPFYKLGEANVTRRLSKEDYFVKKFRPKLNGHKTHNVM